MLRISLNLNLNFGVITPGGLSIRGGVVLLCGLLLGACAPAAGRVDPLPVGWAYPAAGEPLKPATVATVEGVFARLPDEVPRVWQSLGWGRLSLQAPPALREAFRQYHQDRAAAGARAAILSASDSPRPPAAAPASGGEPSHDPRAFLLQGRALRPNGQTVWVQAWPLAGPHETGPMAVAVRAGPFGNPEVEAEFLRKLAQSLRQPPRRWRDRGFRLPPPAP